MYKIYAKTNELGQVTDIKTQEFAGDDWHEIGETENRLHQQPITNERGSFLYEIIDGEMVERDTSADDAAAKKIEDLQKIDAETAAKMTAGYDTGEGIISTSPNAQLNHALTLARIGAGDTSFFPLPISTLDGNFIEVKNEDDYLLLYNSMFESLNAIRKDGIEKRKIILEGSQ